MPAKLCTLTPGLYFVATPIGNARDITLRALDILASADVIAAEDTRMARRLMDLHGVKLGTRPLVAYHDHSSPADRARLMDRIAAGASVAYVSDAGTPLIADPGFALGRSALEAGHEISTAPGASALLAALGVAGLPTDRFLFEGFLPPKSGERRQKLQSLAEIDATLVIYETPKRLARALTDMAACLGPRPLVVCRELTKKFEDIRRGTLEGWEDLIADMPTKGEVVLVLGKGAPRDVQPSEIDAALKENCIKLSLKDSVSLTASTLGLNRRDVYQRALALKDAGEL